MHQNFVHGFMWSGAHLRGRALLFHASNMQRAEMRGAVSGDTAFDFCYRTMRQWDPPGTDSLSMGSRQRLPKAPKQVDL